VAAALRPASINTRLPPNGPFRSVDLTTEAFDKKQNRPIG